MCALCLTRKAPVATANRHVYYRETLHQRRPDCSQQGAEIHWLVNERTRSTLGINQAVTENSMRLQY
jgi:hypothetical protein